MRRWLSILLLLLMPFQFSWAAVGAYCGHETGTRAVHFGHHDHKHIKVVGESGDATQLKAGGLLDVTDCHAHCPCGAALPVAIGMRTVTGASPVTTHAVADPASPAPPRPERPQWPAHA